MLPCYLPLNVLLPERMAWHASKINVIIQVLSPTCSQVALTRLNFNHVFHYFLPVKSCFSQTDPFPLICLFSLSNLFRSRQLRSTSFSRPPVANRCGFSQAHNPLLVVLRQTINLSTSEQHPAAVETLFLYSAVI